MTTGGIVMLAVVGLIWLMFARSLLSGGSSSEENGEKPLEKTKSDSSL